MISYDETYRLSLHTAWEKMINYENWDFSFIRPEVYQSWLFSRSCLVNPYVTKTDVLNTADLNTKINSNLHLIEIVRPYMDRLYSIVEGSGFYILLSDKEGYILDIVGDKDIINTCKNSSMLVVGANRSERFAGTNAIGTCLSLAKPIQLWGEEHYIKAHKDYCCSASPIFDASGNLLGCLNITGHHSQSHSHTLGMVISAVDGINKELKILNAYNEIKMISAQRNSIIESIPSGLILLNETHNVIQVNKKALHMLEVDYQDIIGKDISNFLDVNDCSTHDKYSLIQKETYNKEINIAVNGNLSPPIKLNMSIDFVKDETGHRTGTVIRFNEPQKINKLVNKITGYRSSFTFNDIIGSSDVTKKMINTAKKAAANDSNVLILGESGTGKELIAQSIHNASGCSKGPFVAINCGALPKGLIESELFGYEKGAFTGANREGNPGKFELADGGTIFLDEIGDMPFDVQVALLRVLQTREVVRIGARYPKPINVRVIAATNRNLEEAIEAKSFREDLYYRLNVFTINVPSLRQRTKDVILLTKHFVKTYNLQKNAAFKIDDNIFPVLCSYPWPGNIRELENVIERALNLSDNNTIGLAELPKNILDYPLKHTHTKNQQKEPFSSSETPLINDFTISKPASLKNAEHNLILASLEQSEGNVKKAAEILGISRRTLYRKLEKYKINADLYR